MAPRLLKQTGAVTPSATIGAPTMQNHHTGTLTRAQLTRLLAILRPYGKQLFNPVILELAYRLARDDK
jgi:hypothetical protein